MSSIDLFLLSLKRTLRKYAQSSTWRSRECISLNRMMDDRWLEMQCGEQQLSLPAAKKFLQKPNDFFFLLVHVLDEFNVRNPALCGILCLYGQGSFWRSHLKGTPESVRLSISGQRNQCNLHTRGNL